ncbi:MAG: amidohydrolase family protein [Proteobacteria bacterium]|nr:amidohydrolase family protein [Pseudomonadota bacterium]
MREKAPLVNAHTHLELTEEQSLVNDNLDKKELWDWIIEIVRNKRTLKEEDFIRNIRRAERFLIENNNLFIGEIRSVLPEGPLFYDDRLKGVVFFEVLGYEEEVFNRKWLDFQRFFNKYKASDKIGLSIHSLYTTPPDKAKELVSFARKNRLKVAIHIAEKREESEFLFNKNISGFRKIFKNAEIRDYGFKSYADIIEYLNLGADTILIHCTQFEKSDWNIVKNKDIPVVICPRSNLYFTGKLPDIETVINLDIRWALGTDSLYTNRDINVSEEGSFIEKHFSHIKDIEKKVAYALTENGLEILGVKGKEWL